MPDTAHGKPMSTGNPNNLLKELTVDGYFLTPAYDMYTSQYDLIVPENVSEINIEASPILASATVSGAGRVSLQPGTNQIDIRVKAENGSEKIYTVYVERQQLQDMEFNLTSSIYKIDLDITGVEPETRVDTFKKYLQVSSGEILIVDNSGKQIYGNVGTGSKVQIKEGDQIIKTYPIVVYGDTNGDGKVSIIDLALIQQHILRVNSLSGIYLEAADTNRGKDGVSILDLAFVQRHILNVDTIKQ